MKLVLVVFKWIYEVVVENPFLLHDHLFFQVGYFSSLSYNTN